MFPEEQKVNHKQKFLDITLKVLSYFLAATVGAAAVVALFLNAGPVKQDPGLSKLEELQALIEERFIGEADAVVMEDAAAEAMIAALGDRWSYYIPAAEYQSFMEQMQNAYVGVGITVVAREDGTGIDILQVVAGGPAEEAGLLVGDVIVAVNGETVDPTNLNDLSSRVKGEEGTTVDLTILRDGSERVFTVYRRQIQTPVAEGELLKNGVGLVSIYNFDDRCAQETIAAIEDLLSSGARTLIFDVRNNPGGYKHELVELLDYLLPEGVLFRSEDYTGATHNDYSDPRHLAVPMVVLVNGESYSAAEFFAAALREYNVALLVGEETCGKGYFQQTFNLVDGSAVSLSVGKYYTPKGASMATVGITPDIVVEVDDETFSAIYYGNLDPEEDPQIQEAMKLLEGY